METAILGLFYINLDNNRYVYAISFSKDKLLEIWKNHESELFFPGKIEIGPINLFRMMFTKDLKIYPLIPLKNPNNEIKYYNGMYAYNFEIFNKEKTERRCYQSICFINGIDFATDEEIIIKRFNSKGQIVVSGDSFIPNNNIDDFELNFSFDTIKFDTFYSECIINA